MKKIIGCLACLLFSHNLNGDEMTQAISEADPIYRLDVDYQDKGKTTKVTLGLDEKEIENFLLLTFPTSSKEKIDRRIQAASATEGGQWPGAVRGFRLNDQVNPKCPLTTA